MDFYRLFAVLILTVSVATTEIGFARDDTPNGESDHIDDLRDFIFPESVEAAVSIPPVPDDSAFVKMPVDHAPAGFEVFIDVAGLGFGVGDSSIHFWMLLKSKQGGYNLSYEAYRCSAHSFKTHGWGMRGADPEFRRNKSARWQKVNLTSGGRYRGELDDYYLCQDGDRLSPRDIMDKVRNYAISDEDAND